MNRQDLEKEYHEALREGTLIFRLDNAQTNSRLDIIKHGDEIRYWHLFNGELTDTDNILEPSAGHVVTFDAGGKFGRDYIKQ